jgi:hypothetical protein
MPRSPRFAAGIHLTDTGDESSAKRFPVAKSGASRVTSPLRVPKTPSTQVIGATPDTLNDGLVALLQHGDGHGEVLVRHDDRLCCCDWPI